ncbi:MAG: hypothetical protein ACREM3_26495 [Candidatus Rokuibacteriota bacterium]
MLADLHRTPGKLRDLLGGGAAPPEAAGSTAGSSALTNMFASPLAKAALAGIAAMVVKRVMQGPARTA